MNRRKFNTALKLGSGTVAGAMSGFLLARKAADKTHESLAKIFMEDLYDENLWELISSTTRIGLQNAIETNLA